MLETVAATLDRINARIDVVLVFRPNGEELACVFASGRRAEHLRNCNLRRDGAHLPARAARTGCRALLADHCEAIVPTDRFAVAVPMFDGRTLLAIVYAAATADVDAAAVEAVIESAMRAAAPYALALERELDRAEARLDPLTGLLSARVFRTYLEDEVARAVARDDRYFALWFVDVDAFKAVNDRFGHRVGDRVLRATAALLEAQLTSDLDVAARNGGDEFCALLRATSKGRAIERARAFCEAVRAYNFGASIDVTASVGVAAFPHDAATASALLEVADAAMYRSKAAGRDRVSFVAARGIYTSLPPEAAPEPSRSPLQCRSNSGESSA